MSASPEHEPDAATEPATPERAAEHSAGQEAVPEQDTVPEQDLEKAPRPAGLVSRFASRFRLPLGVVVALIGAVLAVVSATRPLATDTGASGLVVQGAAVGLWLCIAAVGATWAADASRKVINTLAVAGIACYIVFWIAGR